jgi:hypothetical protein
MNAWSSRSSASHANFVAWAMSSSSHHLTCSTSFPLTDLSNSAPMYATSSVSSSYMANYQTACAVFQIKQADIRLRWSDHVPLVPSPVDSQIADTYLDEICLGTQACGHTNKPTNRLSSASNVSHVRMRAAISMNIAGAALSWIDKRVAFGLYICDYDTRMGPRRSSSITLHFHWERDYEYHDALGTCVDLDQLHVTHPKRPERRGFV